MEKWSVITQQVVRSTACYSDTGHSNLTFTVLASKGLKSERSKKEQFVYVDNGGEQLFRNVCINCVFDIANNMFKQTNCLACYHPKSHWLNLHMASCSHFKEFGLTVTYDSTNTNKHQELV